MNVGDPEYADRMARHCFRYKFLADLRMAEREKDLVKIVSANTLHIVRYTRFWNISKARQKVMSRYLICHSCRIISISCFNFYTL